MITPTEEHQLVLITRLLSKHNHLQIRRYLATNEWDLVIEANRRKIIGPRWLNRLGINRQRARSLRKRR